MKKWIENKLAAIVRDVLSDSLKNIISLSADKQYIMVCKSEDDARDLSELIKNTFDTSGIKLAIVSGLDIKIIEILK